VPADGSALYDPNMLRMLQGFDTVRMMDAEATNSSNSLDPATDFSQGPECTYYGLGTIPGRDLVYSVVSIGPEANADGYFNNQNRTLLAVTLSGPHGLADGQFIKFSNMSGTVDMVQGSTHQAFNLNNYTPIIKSRGPTSLSGAIFVGNDAAGVHWVVNGVQAVTGTITTSLPSVPPFADLIGLCNRLGCNLWVNVPHAWPDASVTKLANQVANSLAPRLKVYVEYTNEHWNTAFRQYEYCYGQGMLLGLANPADAYYVLRSYQVHNLFAAALTTAGRPNDLVRVLGSQYAVTAVTTRMVNYALASNIPVDVIALAPYIDVGLANTTPPRAETAATCCTSSSCSSSRNTARSTECRQPSNHRTRAKPLNTYAAVA
jgi:hypothetical protein